MYSRPQKILLFVLTAGIVLSCSTQRKLAKIKSGETAQMGIAVSGDMYSPERGRDTVNNIVTKDTIQVDDFGDTKVFIMKAIKDEKTGEMVATETIEAAKVTATFRNVAERGGKVDISFKISVPFGMLDSKWQIRLQPVMTALQDTISLDPIYITGKDYRKAQMRGYQLYDKFLSKIVSDSTKFIDVAQLEVFLERNIPQIYAFKSDSTVVDENLFTSYYGLSQQQAVEHYTNKLARQRNQRRKEMAGERFNRYVKVPIVTEGIRLDTVIVKDGDFEYNYTQTINVRPRQKKAEITIGGDIFEMETKVFDMPSIAPLTYYISSVSSFADNTERYLTKVLERRVMADAEYRIEFPIGSSIIKADFSDNASEIDKINHTLSSLVQNEEFEIDSITVSATASPEGNYSVNKALALKRSEAVTSYFSRFVKQYVDSLINERGVVANLDETFKNREYNSSIEFIPICIPENWDGLCHLVDEDVVMNIDQKDIFHQHMAESDLDKREALMRKDVYYNYMRETIYPRLRRVKFNFHLHRRGMVKDTVMTTVIDSVYMRGVNALKDMDYKTAVALLRPYRDFNSAVAFVGLNLNASALDILKDLEPTAQINYLMALLYARTGDPAKAVEFYLKSCKENPSYVFRGNLDPEISALVKAYGLENVGNNEVF